MVYRIIPGVCETELNKLISNDSIKEIHLTILNPPTIQPKEEIKTKKSNSLNKYWQWIKRICQKILTLTAPGGAIYFIHREEQVEFALNALRISGWTFQNLIIWKRLTSIIPHQSRFDDQYSPIIFATKGEDPRVFHRLQIDSPMKSYNKKQQNDGFTITNAWNDIPELNINFNTSYNGNIPKTKVSSAEEGRFPKEQLPTRLLTRIILASSLPYDLILDPFAGTGVTAAVAEQLTRNSISIELDPRNINIMKKRLVLKRPQIDISKFYYYYRFTDYIDSILPLPYNQSTCQRVLHSLRNSSHINNKN